VKKVAAYLGTHALNSLMNSEDNHKPERRTHKW
jgi:hypothetical protein